MDQMFWAGVSSRLPSKPVQYPNSSSAKLCCISGSSMQDSCLAEICKASSDASNVTQKPVCMPFSIDCARCSRLFPDVQATSSFTGTNATRDQRSGQVSGSCSRVASSLIQIQSPFIYKEHLKTTKWAKCCTQRKCYTIKQDLHHAYIHTETT